MRRLPAYVLFAMTVTGCKKKIEEPEISVDETASSPWGEESPSEAQTDGSAPAGEENSSAETDEGGTATEDLVAAEPVVSTAGAGRAGIEGQLIQATGQLTLQTTEGAQAALSILQPLSSEYPDIAGIFHNIGVAYLQLGEDFKAMDAFQRATTIDPVSW